MRVHQLQEQVVRQKETNQALVARNTAMQAEVQDLKSGTDAVEERARGELGMIKEGEIYVQILAPHEPRLHVKTPKLASPDEKKGN